MSSLSSGSLSTSDIVGIAVGGALTLVTIVGLLITCIGFCYKKKNTGVAPQQFASQQFPPQQPQYSYPPPNYNYGQPSYTPHYPPAGYNQPSYPQQYARH